MRQLHRISPARAEQQVEAGLPKASLGAVARHVYGNSPDAAALMQRVIPAATFHRRGEELKPQEGERVERLARVIATAEYRSTRSSRRSLPGARNRWFGMRGCSGGAEPDPVRSVGKGT